MRILAVNVLGLPSGERRTLLDADVFQDYDAVVVDPESFEALYGYRSIQYQNVEQRILDSEFAAALSNINAKRRDEVNGLLLKNGIIVCFLRNLFTYRDAKQNYFISNYSWLMDPSDIHVELDDIIYGTGRTIDYIDSGHPFFDYLATNPHWTAYIDQSAYDESEWKILASAYGTNVLSLVKTVGNGHIILLPSYYNDENGGLLEQCIINLLRGEEITPVPAWVQSIYVPGQKQKLSDIEKVQIKIDSLNKERDSLILENQTLERWKWLLYESGTHRLEVIVRDALSLIGCRVDPPSNEESDGLLHIDAGIALLEVEGKIETIKIDKISQLIKNMANYSVKNQMPAKGILVGNPFREEHPSNRPPKNTQKKLFSKELLETAEMQNISVLLSTDLYYVVCKIIANKISAEDKQSIRKLIFQGKGLIRLI